MWHAHEGMGWWMVFGGVLWFLFWLVVVSLVVWAVASLAGSASRAARDKKEAREIARVRYAKGEITKEQFNEIKRELG